MNADFILTDITLDFVVSCSDLQDCFILSVPQIFAGFGKLRQICVLQNYSGKHEV